jgi:hypothetical protein
LAQLTGTELIRVNFTLKFSRFTSPPFFHHLSVLSTVLFGCSLPLPCEICPQHRSQCRHLSSTKATTVVTATLPRLPMPRPLTPLLLLPLPHFVDCCLSLPFMLLSATTIATVAAAAPVSILTPSLDDPGIVASSLTLSLALRSLIFDYDAPASLWLTSRCHHMLPQLLSILNFSLFVCTGWLLHLIVSYHLPLPSLHPLEALPPLDEPLPPPPICHLFVWAASPLVMLLPLYKQMPLVCPGW